MILSKIFVANCLRTSTIGSIINLAAFTKVSNPLRTENTPSKTFFNLRLLASDNFKVFVNSLNLDVRTFIPYPIS